MATFRSTLLLSACAAVALPFPCAAQAPDRNPPALQKVIDCRAVADDRARLACFDASVTQLDAARSSGAIAVFDREEVNKTRRGLFGFSLPSLGIFGGGNGKDRRADADEIKEITGKIRTAQRNYEGGWVITLEDGARWEQTEPMTFGRAPKPGSTATIKRAALGSYKMSIDGSPAVKAHRIG